MSHDADPLLSRYISRVKEFPTLSREDEHALALRVRDHADPAAAEALVNANLRYVVAIAVNYRRYDIRLADLVGEGSLGLVTAVKKFDPDKGTRFVTYAAYWIRAFILNAVIRSWSLVGGGSGPLRSKLFFRLRRERARMANLVGETEAAMERLAEQLGTTPEKVEEMMRRLDARDVSLDAPVHDDGRATGVDLLESAAPAQDDALDEAREKAHLDGRVRDAMRGLDPRERYIVEQRIMSDDELSLAEIGRRLGVSRERARQLEARARKKLTRALADLAPADVEAQGEAITEATSAPL
ncbi:MAG: RNA polymerase factor sigma-32 [Polyangiales bacterium]